MLGPKSRPVASGCSPEKGSPPGSGTGTACLWSGGRLWKRYESKARKRKFLPEGFRLVEVQADGDEIGWIPVGQGPEDTWHRFALVSGKDSDDRLLEDGATYELCGPKVQGNPEGFQMHVLVMHGAHPVPEVIPRTFETIRGVLAFGEIEGIVWWHQDGRMAKMKAKDFGINRILRHGA